MVILAATIWICLGQGRYIKGLSLGYANNEAGPCMGLRIQTQTIFDDENSSAFIFISFS